MQTLEEIGSGSSLVLALYGFITVAFGAAVVIHFKKSKATLNLNLCTCMHLLLLFFGLFLSYSYLPQYTGVVFFGLCCYTVFRTIRSNAILSPQGKAVLITGCDLGFGHTLAKRLHSLGFHVFATVLHEDGDGARVLKSFGSDRLMVIQMDVTNWAMVQEVEKKIGKQLENKGELPFGRLSPYSTSKAALELFADILRQEMKPWEVQISIIQPGATKTGQVGNAEVWEQDYGKLVENLSPALLRDYGEEYFAELKQAILTIGPLFRQHVDPVIETIVTALLVQHPKPRYTTEYIVDVLKILYYFLPSFMSDVILNEVFIAHKLLPKGVRSSNISQ
ncbi:11-beta-hydroxysteroid dehydrogenase type 2-like isoform X2 [Pristis pectinata]|uniref:11-beta-hydroxysteroid dehydrogenase type 2-like isoform X2 n=1 Tax=Pristis pectinata TaxID=685728 RepID=UPI00223D73A3|nr:11-beta-hydroxysteroid dehydrogenase type 2-like isoform X2 [Pristis pectinata]